MKELGGRVKELGGIVKDQKLLTFNANSMINSVKPGVIEEDTKYLKYELIKVNKSGYKKK